MEVQAVTLVLRSDFLNFACMSSLGQHVDDLEGILDVRTVRIWQNNVYTICREVALVDWNPLRFCCIPRHKCNVIERCAVLAAGKIGCQFCLDFFYCV